MEVTKETYPIFRPGITVEDGKVSALVWSPQAKSVSVITSGGAVISLKKIDFGYWYGVNLPLNVGDRYKIQLNGKDQFPDPASLAQPDGVHDYSQVVDLHQYKWGDGTWKGIALNDMIIYELHVGTFSTGGDFNGVEERLNYLVDLGINVVELMPLAQFPGSRNWGYDGVFPYAVQNSYGGAYQFKKLVDACHSRGLAVVLDVVYNHLGPEGNYLGNFGPYFTQKYQTPWGAAINFDDAGCHGVRHFFIQNALMWMRDFHVDGLRLDAVHAIKDFGTPHFLLELHEEVLKLNRASGKKHFLIGECDLNDVRYINSPDVGGYGLDAQWCDEFHHSMHAKITGEQNGYYSDFGGIKPLVKTLNDAFVYDGNYSVHRDKFFGSKTVGQSGSKFVVFSQNHDQVGNRMLGDRLTNSLDFETLKLIAGFTLLSPYVPMLFMGEEYGEQSSFLYFTHHGDADLVEAIRKGRAEEFRDFMDERTAPPDPQSEDTFNRSKLTQFNSLNDEQYLLHQFYKALIKLRKSDFDLSPTFPREQIEVRSEGECIILIHKKKISNLMAYFNFSDHPVSFGLDDQNSKYALIYSSADTQWGGIGSEFLIHTHLGYELNLTSTSFCVVREYHK